MFFLQEIKFYFRACRQIANCPESSSFQIGWRAIKWAILFNIAHLIEGLVIQ